MAQPDELLARLRAGRCAVLLRHTQTAQLRAALAAIPAGQFEVSVTHQVNISALSGEGTSMGEALVLDTRGKMVARNTFS